MQSPDLFPIPFSTLVDRLARECGGDELYCMPRREWWTPVPGRDTSITHLGRRIATPAGPASGPHTQMAQNLVLSFLGGGRFMELKTVQVNDELEIPRPCIYVPHIGFNVEWSQELRVGQSAIEYAAGWMLLHMLCSEHGPGLWGSDPLTTFDVSIGYDLEGIQSQKVRGYLDAMRDATSIIDTLRAELPPHLSKWAQVDVPPQISDSITISTFHGCPATEIEAIAAQTLDWGWHTVVKLNPTLLGYDTVRGMLDEMGYERVVLNREDFDKDLSWGQLEEMIPRLQAKADGLGLGFGFKLTNTLVCHSDETPFYPDKGGAGEMYLSGPPLHVVSYTLAQKLRQHVGPQMPLTFSAGVDRDNFVPCVAGSLGPVTSCSDLLKGRGYGRMTKYVRALEKAMAGADCDNVEALQQAMSPTASGAQIAAAQHGADIARTLLADVRYHDAANAKAPKKVGTHLELFDCLTCDKCIPVCPNAANFSFPVPEGSYAGGPVRWADGQIDYTAGTGELVVAKRHQIGNVADVCNECGQCDPWCPEDGGPFIEKPTVFLSEETAQARAGLDGFWFAADGTRLFWRRKGVVLQYTQHPDGSAVFDGEHGSLVLEQDTPVSATGHGEVDLAHVVTMRLYLEAWSDPEVTTWLPPRTAPMG